MGFLCHEVGYDKILFISYLLKVKAHIGMLEGKGLPIPSNVEVYTRTAGEFFLCDTGLELLTERGKIIRQFQRLKTGTY